MNRLFFLVYYLYLKIARDIIHKDIIFFFFILHILLQKKKLLPYNIVTVSSFFHSMHIYRKIYILQRKNERSFPDFLFFIYFFFFPPKKPFFSVFSSSGASLDALESTSPIASWNLRRASFCSFVMCSGT